MNRRDMVDRLLRPEPPPDVAKIIYPMCVRCGNHYSLSSQREEGNVCLPCAAVEPRPVLGGKAI